MVSRGEEGCRQDYWLKWGRKRALEHANGLTSQQKCNDKPEKPSEAEGACCSHLLQQKAASADHRCATIKKKVSLKGGHNTQPPPPKAALMPLAVDDLKTNHLLSFPAALSWHLHGDARCWWREHPSLERAGGTTPYPIISRWLCLWGSQDCVQLCFEYLQGWRLRNLSGLGTVHVLPFLHIKLLLPFP